MLIGCCFTMKIPYSIYWVYTFLIKWVFKSVNFTLVPLQYFLQGHVHVVRFSVLCASANSTNSSTPFKYTSLNLLVSRIQSFLGGNDILQYYIYTHAHTK
ncbi:LOW QUALITY PROTEIN: hypothetical protein AQUCO_00100650v1 [Aquilegia coerulea]|nr:LOW QUALITY PROTEIN: hypothetical protein AQUCO_00100650v1 [Aquilegia coerulea]